jgi:hypothetical protein
MIEAGNELEAGNQAGKRKGRELDVIEKPAHSCVV